MLSPTQAFRERPMIVRAMGLDGENPRFGLHQQDFPIPDVTEQLLVGELRERDTMGQIGAGWRRLLLRSRLSP